MGSALRNLAGPVRPPRVPPTGTPMGTPSPVHLHSVKHCRSPPGASLPSPWPGAWEGPTGHSSLPLHWGPLPKAQAAKCQVPATRELLSRLPTSVFQTQTSRRLLLAPTHVLTQKRGCVLK